MATPSTVVSVSALAADAQSLVEAASRLAQIAQKLADSGLSEATLPWTNTHWKAIDAIVERIPLIEGAANREIGAHKAGRPSRAAQERERARKNYEKLKEKRAAEGATQKRRGRPRKS